MSGLTGPLDPRGFYENQQGVVAPIQRIFNGGNGNSNSKNNTFKKPNLRIRKAPIVTNENGNPVLGPNGKPIEKIWSERESPGIGTAGSEPEQGWITPAFNLSLGNKTGGKKRKTKNRRNKRKQRKTRRNRRH